MELKTKPVITSSHGWPDDLLCIRLPDGKYMANNADTRGMDSDPMEMNGLALHKTQESADIYIQGELMRPFPGALAVPILYLEARAIAIERDMDCLLLFEGERITDVEYLQ